MRRTLRTLAGAVALLVGGAVDAAPTASAPTDAAETDAAETDVATDAAVKKPSPPPTAAELLAEVRAAGPASEKWWKALRRLGEEHDGTVELVEASVIMLAGSRDLWLKRGDPEILVSPLQKVEASKSYALSEAAELRRLVAAYRAEIAEWQAILDHVDRGRRGDREAFVRCGEAAQAIVARIGARDPRVPWLLRWSAMCLDASGQWPEAAQTYERLLALAPEREWTRGTIGALVEGNFAVARYDEAARYAERYAKRYPKDEWSPDYLRIAYLSRLGLDQPDRALVALDALEEMYVRSWPERAARYHWLRREVLTDDAARLRHAEQFLVRYAKSARDYRIVAEVEVGRLKWQRSCEKAPTLAACASFSRGPAAGGGRHCGERATVRFEVFDRDAGLAEEAQRYFAAAPKLARYDVKIPIDDIERIEAFRAALATAELLIVDRGFDELLRLLAQVRDAGARDLRQPAEPLARVAELAATLEQQYTQVVTKHDRSESSIAAAARIGQIAELRADALLLREIPRELTGKAAGALCATRREQVAPLHRAALAAYERCIELSIANGTFTEFSRMCEDGLTRREPRRFPPLAEIVAVSAEPATRPDWIGAQLDEPREVAAASAERGDEVER